MPITTELDAEFQRALGRAPTEAERRYYSELLSKPSEYPFSVPELGFALQGGAEGQRRSLEGDTNALESRLRQSDDYFLGRARDVADSSFRRMGRSDSSGLYNAYMNSARDMGTQRQNALANFYAGGLGEVRGLQQMYASRPTDLKDRAWQNQRDEALADKMYFRQQNDYNTYGRQMQKTQRNSMIGAGVGYFVGGVPGMLAGQYIGGR